MKVEHLKKLPALFLSIFLVAVPAAPVFANKPYFKTYGSDVMTGGWFEANNTCDTTTYYQNPSYSGPGITADDRTGGILAFALEKGGSGKADGGASSQYAAYSLGYIEEDHTRPNSPEWGFYSDGANIGGSTRATDLTFANQNPALPAGAWGGMFEGTATHSHCIPDYYSQKPSGAKAINPGTKLNDILDTTGSGDYTVTPAGGTNYDLTSGNVTVPANTRINIYVDGNVYIGSNIVYGSSVADQVPKLRIVAKGSIYIDPAVRNIDGWYIAQPDMSVGNVLTDDTGVIWTCHPNDQQKVLDTYLTSPPCSNTKLTVNGALVAKKFNLVRLNGDVANANTSEDDLTTGLASGNIAEIVNYTPAMVIGGGFINYSSDTGPLPIDSLISLPPVF